MITTVAGTGAVGYSGDGGPATHATMNQPYSLQIDTNGDIYIVDRLNAVIRKVEAATGIITTVAGTGESGSVAMVVQGHALSCASPTTVFSMVAAGSSLPMCRTSASGAWICVPESSPPLLGPGTRRGLGMAVLPPSPVSSGRERVYGPPRQYYICEREGNGIRKVDAHGIMSTYAGTGERGYSGDRSPALTATWGAPKAIRCDHHGNLLVVDTENHAIRLIDAVTGVVTTIAGGRRSGAGDDGPAIAAGLDRPHGCDVDAQGSIYIADSNNHRVRVVGAR